MSEVIYGLKTMAGIFLRRADGALVVFSTRADAALWANQTEIIAALGVTDLS